MWTRPVTANSERQDQLRARAVWAASPEERSARCNKRSGSVSLRDLLHQERGYPSVPRFRIQKRGCSSRDGVADALSHDGSIRELTLSVQGEVKSSPSD